MNVPSTLRQPSRAPPLHRLPQLRREMLRDNLLVTMGHLYRRHASLIEAGYIEDYVALHWLEWNGGTLRLTDSGHRVCNELSRP